MRLESEHVISSAPMRELINGLEPAVSKKQSAPPIRSNIADFLTVMLILKNRDAFHDNWIYIHDPSVKVGRIQNFRSWSPEMVPDPDKACYGLEYFCFEHDGLWDSKDEDLIALAQRELIKIGLAREGDILDGCVVRQKKAYPVYDDDYAEHVATIRDELDRRYPNLHLVGRNGMHKYNNQDHAMMTAMLCAENIIANTKLYDLWQVNQDAEYHEAGDAPAEQTVGTAIRLVPTRVTSYALSSRPKANCLAAVPRSSPFRDRADAGRQLAENLLSYAGRDDVIVLALPRGGVPVAFEVAQRLGVPLDVFVVRKLGVPGHEELAMGAIASGGVRVLNEDVALRLARCAIDRRDGHRNRTRGIGTAGTYLSRRSAAAGFAWANCDSGR